MPVNSPVQVIVLQIPVKSVTGVLLNPCKMIEKYRAVSHVEFVGIGSAMLIFGVKGLLCCFALENLCGVTGPLKKQLPSAGKQLFYLYFS